MRKKFLSVILFFTVISLNFSGCGNTKQSADNSDEQIVLKFGHVAALTEPYHLGLVKMAELVEEGTDGRYRIEIYPSAQLGGERDLVEGVKLGSVDGCLTACAPISNFSPSIAAIELPGLINDYDQADRVFMGEIGQEICDTISQDAKVKALGIWEDGFTCIATSKKQVNSLEDLKGLKIRTMESQIHQMAIKSMGADPVPMAWGEAYTAVQQGALDGLVNGLVPIYAQKVGEICKYIAVTNHIYSPAVLIMNQDIWEQMSEEDKKVFEFAAKEANLTERKLNRENEEEARKKLAEEGVSVVDIDKEEVQKAVFGVEDELFKDKESKELIDKIRNS
ncbi:TRAP transporter substrate-binding protein DctP [Lachnospiraceae bacterium NSJ-143]|nr:TRAP transporter substrate-binding protein DctP [Lachnospiraceae bacterium NSJ-143]